MLVSLLERSPRPLIERMLALPAGGNATPVASFTAIATGRSVAFTDTSTDNGTITAWDWDFGDGTAHGTTQNPTHFYSADDDYTVTLIVTDNQGKVSVAYADDVTVAALTPTALLHTSGSTVATQAAFDTASVTLAVGKVYVAFPTAVGSSAMPSPSGLASSGATWLPVTFTGATGVNTTGAPNRKITAWAAVGTGATGAITITYPTDVGLCLWHVVELTDVRAVAAARQGVATYTASGTTVVNSLAALGNAKNVNLSSIMTRSAGHAAVTPDAQFAELADTDLAASTVLQETQWALGEVDCTPTWAGTDSAVLVSLEFEAG